MLLLLSQLHAEDLQRWAVTGVAADDTLNVRASGDPAAPVLGTLPPNTIDLIELDMNEAGWYRVRAGTLEGWVNGRYLVPQAPADLPGSLACRGTEPFWSVVVSAGTATPSTPTRPKGSTVPVTHVRATQHMTWLVSPTSRRSPDLSWLTVSFDPSLCSDGMSDVRYPYRAQALLGDGEPGFVVGCCRIEPSGSR